MRIRVLGPLEVFDGQRWQHIGAPKWRLLLALLIVDSPTPVPVGRLEDELWPDGAPRSAANQIHGYVSRLRRVLGDPDGDLLCTRSPGYQLRLEPDDLDVRRFERDADDGLRALRGNDPELAARLLAEALGLWRGPAYADIPENLTVEAEVGRLDERRLVALEGRLDADLRRGLGAELIPQLRRLVADHPLREHFWEQLMLAYARAGRPGDALLAYRELYDALTDQLGIEPGRSVRELHRRLLATGDDSELAGPSGAPSTSGPALGTGTGASAVPRQLPPDVTGFTGRTEALAELDAMVGPDRIVLIDGTAGVGKTALATHWGHRNTARFGDGQLYLDLRGFGPDAPLTPADALGRLLRALGVEPARIPPDVDEASALLRTRLADRNPLVVLDNASDVAQLEPLLCPGSVIVTSRNRLTGLVARHGAHRLELHRLDTAQGVRLLRRVLGPRVDAEPEAANELAELGGGLPLALRITAARLADETASSLAEHVMALRTGDRLGSLRVEGDARADVRTVFAYSYEWLAPEARRMLRLLGRTPGPDVGPDGAAAIAELPVSEAERLLDTLAGAHLVERRDAGRYAPHDLVKLYAAELASESEAGPATARLLGWYLYGIDQAVRLIQPTGIRLRATIPPHPPPPAFENAHEAQHWLQVERVNLLAAARLAAHRGGPSAWLFGDRMRTFYLRQRYTVEWLAFARIGLDAAVAAEDVAGQASALLTLGQAERCVGRHDIARQHLEAAVRAGDQVGWHGGQAQALNDIAIVDLERGELGRAIEPLERAITHARAMDSRLHLTTYLMNLGMLQWQLGRLSEAANRLAEVLRLADGPNNDQPRALAGTALGMVERLRGRPGASLARLETSLSELRRLGHDAGLVGATGQLALVHCDLGNHAEARSYAETAVTTATDVGNPRLTGGAMIIRGEVRRRTGDTAGALTDGEEGVRLASEAGLGIELAEGQVALGLARRAEGRIADAIDAVRAGYEQARESDFRATRCRAADVLAELYADRGEHARSRELAAEAEELMEQTGVRLPERRSPSTDPD